MDSTPGHHLTGSRTTAAGKAMTPPFPDPSFPTQDPFRTIPVPDHVSLEIWQDSYYEAGSKTPVSVFVKRPAGTLNISNGQFTGNDFPDSGLWTQV